MIFSKISDKVFIIEGPPAYANVTALILPKHVVLVDAGIQLPSVLEVQREIEEISKRKIGMVIFTHFHSDHTRALPAFSKCRTISSNLVLKNLKQAGRKPPTGYELTFPNETFENHLELKEENIRLTVKRTGGHTDGSTYVYCPSYKVIAAGDNFWNNYFPWGGARNGDPDMWIQALQEYLSFNVKYFIPGHGPIGGSDKVQELLSYIINVRDVMKEMIASGKTKEETIKAGDAVEHYVSGIAKSSTLKKWYKIWKYKFNK